MDQLTNQNNGQPWRDCNAAGLPHLWRFSHRVSHDGVPAFYHECQRCPVRTRTVKTIMPERFLP
jgi:hypothetical protein